jgi:hypothetical protein
MVAAKRCGGLPNDKQKVLSIDSAAALLRFVGSGHWFAVD